MFRKIIIKLTCKTLLDNQAFKADRKRWEDNIREKSSPIQTLPCNWKLNETESFEQNQHYITWNWKLDLNEQTQTTSFKLEIHIETEALKNQITSFTIITNNIIGN